MPDDWSPLDAAHGGRPRWFGRKRVGWGWSPRTWPGYLVTCGLIAAIEAITVGARDGWVYLAAAIPLVMFAVRTAARQAAGRSGPRRRG